MVIFFHTQSTKNHQKIAENGKKHVFQANIESNIKSKNASENLTLLKLDSIILD